MSEGETPIEFDIVEAPAPRRAERGAQKPATFRVVAAATVAVLVVGAVVWSVLSGAGEERSAPGDADAVLEAMPSPLRVAVTFELDPSGEHLRHVIEAIGGLEALMVGEATGAFDLVGFDPLDDRRLLASKRSSYGAAQNQDTTEQWVVDGAAVRQVRWAPDTPHDFVGYNPDGTTTMWVHGGGTGFAPRIARTVTGNGVTIATTEPMYASRWAVSNGTVFALTGNGDYYTPAPHHVDLIADDGTTQTRLAAGDEIGWIDAPVPGLIIAHSNRATGTNRVWDAETRRPIDDHPLAGRNDQRVAISGDRSTVLAVTAAGDLDRVDPATGATIERIGRVDIRDVDRPITLSHDGSTAVTVEGSGQVTLWWVADGTAVATVSGDAAQPRWLSSRYAARSTSVVSADASRLALRRPAGPQQRVRWSILDIAADDLVDRACDLAGRRLTRSEIVTLGVPDDRIPCR